MYFSLVQFLDRKGVSFCCRTTYDDNAITNAVDIYDSSRYVRVLLLINNLAKNVGINYIYMHYAVVLFISWRQIMTVEFETMIWRSFNFASISPSLGQ